MVFDDCIDLGGDVAEPISMGPLAWCDFLIRPPAAVLPREPTTISAHCCGILHKNFRDSSGSFNLRKALAGLVTATMNSTHFVREQCRHVLHRPRISIPSNATEGCRSAQRAFSQSQISRAEDGGRIRLPKAPTRLRRQMYAWLNTKGRLFAEPSSQGTNYLSDYNAAGIRRDQTSQSRANEEVDEDEGEEPNEDAEPTLEESSRRTSSSARTTPKHPFPRNRAFRSEPVLREELKNAIYRRVVKDGHSISAVGAEYSVDMRRVAAVVRLKEVEKLWEKEVSLSIYPSLLLSDDTI